MRGTPAADGSGKAGLVASALIVVLAAALRFHALGTSSLWFDEAVYANNSHADFPTFLANTRAANSSPIVLPYLYYVLGDAVRDSFSVRVMPAFFGVAAVAGLLALPLVGMPSTIAIPAALWLALCPMQIHFSQEVREYSLGTFLAVMLLAAFVAHASLGTLATGAACAAMLAIAPLCSYGTVLLGGALLGALLVVRVARRGFAGAIDVLPAAAALAAGVAASYLLTARHQMGQMTAIKSGYLAAFYPPEGAAAAAAWLVKQTALYMSFATGSRILAVVSGLALAAATVVHVASMRNRRATESGVDGQAVCLIAAVFLVLGSMVLGLARAYPFGGLRQHLFAGPALILATVIGVQRLARVRHLRPGIVAAASSCLVVAMVGPGIPSAYGKGEDIRPLVDRYLATVPPADVYVYHAAAQAVTFHYPARAFVIGRPPTELPADTVDDVLSRMSGPDIWILAAHFTDGDLDTIVAGLIARGWRLEVSRVTNGAAIVHLHRDADESAPAHPPGG